MEGTSAEGRFHGQPSGAMLPSMARLARGDAAVLPETDSNGCKKTLYISKEWQPTAANGGIA